MSEKNEKGKQVTTTNVTRKVDVTKLISIIPPATELRRKEVKIREKRVRIRWSDELPVGIVKIAKSLAENLGINEGDNVEIVVAGRHKFIYKAVIVDEGNMNEVYCNPEELRERGVADKSITTIRKASRG